MIDTTRIVSTEFDQSPVTCGTETSEAAPNIRERSGAYITLGLAAAAIKFASIDRIPRYSPERRENDAEHSFMLAIIAPELASEFYPKLNPALVHQYATFHDLIELETGDVATYALDAHALARKEAAEHAALQRLAATLPPYTGRMVAAYEAQADPEARFVRCVDKLLPLAVDILGPGSQVMHEDYNVRSRGDLRVSQSAVHERLGAMFGHEFPEIMSIHRTLSLLFRHQFVEFADAA